MFIYNHLRECRTHCASDSYLNYVEALAWAMVAEENGEGERAKSWQQRILLEAGMPDALGHHAMIDDYLRRVGK